MGGARAFAAFLLLLASLVGVSRADAVLDAPPLALEVTPSRVVDGEPVTLRVTPRGRGAAGTYDIYIVWATGERAAFLAPDGTWSPRPVAFRAGHAVSTAITAPWPRPGPPGEVPLALLVVPPGAPPLARAQWRFRPALTTLTVAPATPPPDAPWSTTLLLALAAAVACAIVVLDGRAGGGLSRPRPL